MTATLNDVTSRKRKPDPSAEELAAAELVRLAKAQGLSLTGPDGLLKQLTKTVLETALNEEMTEHLGYGKHEVAGAGGGNVRNGSRAKTVLTDASGHVRRGRQHEPMRTVPESTKVSLGQRLRERARERGAALSTVDVRHRAGFAYITATSPTAPPCRCADCATAATPTAGASPSTW